MKTHGKQLLHIGLSGRREFGRIAGWSSWPLRDFSTICHAIRSGLSAGWPTPAGIAVSGDDQQTANGELVSVLGSFTFQSEVFLLILYRTQA